MNTVFFRLVEKAASGRYLHSNDTPPCPPRPPLYAPQDVVSERTLKVMLVFGRRLYFILLYVELTISFLAESVQLIFEISACDVIQMQIIQ